MFSEDFQAVLLFMSRSMKPFLAHTGLYLAMFFLTVLALVPGFFLSLSLGGSMWGFASLAMIVGAAHWWIRRRVVFPSLVRLDWMFLHFLQEREGTPVMLEGKHVGSELRQLRKNLRRFALFRFSRGIQAAAIVLWLDLELRFEGLEGRWDDILKDGYRYIFRGYLLLGLLLFVFWGISFLSTFGLDLPIKLLIFTLGAVFAAFLHQAVIEPMIYLLTLRRMHSGII